jgi:hypothetical protein
MGRFMAFVRSRVVPGQRWVIDIGPRLLPRHTGASKMARSKRGASAPRASVAPQPMFAERGALFLWYQWVGGSECVAEEKTQDFLLRNT